MADTKESVDTFKKCYVKHAQHPTFSTGAIQVGKEDDKVVKFFAVSAQKDTTRLISRKSLKSFASVDSKIITFPFPADFENVSNFAFDINSGKLALARSISPKDGKPDVFIEIWQDGVLVKSIKATGKHGPVYEQEGAFGGLSWAADGKRLLYAAEESRGDPTGYFDAPAKEACDAGQKFVRKEAWGEGMTTVVASTIVILDTESEEFLLPLAGRKEAACWGQPVWAPSTHTHELVCVGYHATPRKLGLKFCLNRHSSIYAVGLDGVVSLLSHPQVAARSPIFSPSGSLLIWLENNVGGPHATGSRLMKLAWGPGFGEDGECSTLSSSIGGPAVVVDVVADDRAVGVYGQRLPSSCFISETEIVFTTYHRSTRVAIQVDVGSSVMAPLQHDGLGEAGACVCDVLCAQQGWILAVVTSPVQPQSLWLGRADGIHVQWTAATTPRLALEGTTTNL